MTLWSLPPVCRAVSLKRASPMVGMETFSGAFAGREVHLYDSGTTALTVALLDARMRHGSSHPEAIVPAYGCPQLVAACLYASVQPRLVDTSPGHWGYDLAQLRAALSRDTVAVVAVNLLGVGDQARHVLPLAKANGSMLIQDSAQYLPAKQEANWSGDYVVLSFGRGKPLNLLRGGALAVSREHSLIVPQPERPAALWLLLNALMGSRAAAVTFNLATRPYVYWLTARLPGLGVGTTRFEPLRKPTGLPLSTWGQLGAAFDEYSLEDRRLPWVTALPEWEHLGIHVLCCPDEAPQLGGRLLRLALLAQGREHRDSLVDSLTRRGLGASIMYGGALNRVDRIPREVALQGPFPNAELLAGRLFTLPTHRWVSAETVNRISVCLRATACEGTLC